MKKIHRYVLGTIAIIGISMHAVSYAHEHYRDKTLKELNELVAQGDPEAQYELGIWNMTAKIGYLDHPKAMELLHLAAAQEHIKAAYYLGNLYEAGLGAETDYNKAAKYYTQAMNQGDAEAMWRIGLLYNSGHGVEKDTARGQQLLRLSAVNGSVFGQQLLGSSFLEGTGTKKNEELALYWLLKAAVQRSPQAHDTLLSPEGKALINSVVNNLDTDNADLLYMLGVAYTTGKTVYTIAQDYERGRMLIEKAAELGHAEAVDYVERHDPDNIRKSVTEFLNAPEQKQILLEMLEKMSATPDK